MFAFQHKAPLLAGLVLMLLIAAVVTLFPAGDTVQASPVEQGTGTFISEGAEAHGALNWQELGWDGLKPGGTRYKVGIIDLGFSGSTAGPATPRWWYVPPWL